MTDGSDLAWLGLERHGEGRWSFDLTPPLSRIGAVSVLAVLPPLGFLAITGLTGFPGITGPIWLAVVSGGIFLRGER